VRINMSVSNSKMQIMVLVRSYELHAVKFIARTLLTLQ
jgi:hypothetical protein